VKARLIIARANRQSTSIARHFLCTLHAFLRDGRGRCYIDYNYN